MLLNISIKNFGLMEQVKIDFQEGLNILTGETGTGKTIIIDALEIALGGRAHTEQIRSGAEKALVEAAFDPARNKFLEQLLGNQGIDLSEEDCLVLSREITRSGKNICRVNGQAVPLAFYKIIGKSMADLHVQHEQNSLLNQEKHRELLDHFGGTKLLELLGQVKSAYQSWSEARSRLEKLQRDAGDRTRRADTLRYQIEEIRHAKLTPGEEEELVREKEVLANSEKISLLAGEAYRHLYDGNEGQDSAMDLLARAAENLKSLVFYDSRAKNILVALESSLYQAEDAARDLAAYRDTVEYSPRRLEAVEERLNQIKILKKKYGDGIPAILQFLDSAGSELQNLLNLDEELTSSGRELSAAAAAYYQAAKELSSARKSAARLLEERVAVELDSLEMGRVVLSLEFTPIEEPSPAGLEQIEFLISPNRGEPLKPLTKIASGGELSRIMLALKTLLAQADDKPVLVFDEVDAGIGGRALQAVAEKLSQLGQQRQVICVTHSAQVAAHARAHHRILKEFDGERTVTRVELLDREQQVEELARMLGGKNVTDITRLHASQMLKNSDKI
ncbi:DNA repair protein RecN [Pelotomaculum sp. FP]|uniref:DNA repair protein RecN n=1 Tax=Pelotomaculum sp. FP TaxID=261474 RepID=UPI001064CD7B|nr:DNA repair protein RecN [Pelotomaculum sp. FP]TEB17532.1 DNA repair protein RecN [Pelotomaculum sp. FP]